jgi:hypothetical protein
MATWVIWTLIACAYGFLVVIDRNVRDCDGRNEARQRELLAKLESLAEQLNDIEQQTRQPLSNPSGLERYPDVPD